VGKTDEEVGALSVVRAKSITGVEILAWAVRNQVIEEKKKLELGRGHNVKKSQP